MAYNLPLSKVLHLIWIFPLLSWNCGATVLDLKGKCINTRNWVDSAQNRDY